jgi:hypothetical protein
MPEKVSIEPIRLQIAVQGGGAKIVALLAAAEYIQKLDIDRRMNILEKS